MLDWSRIDTVLLDMDGTLLDLHFDNHFWLEHLPRHVADREGADLEQVQRRLGRQTHAVRGQLNWYCTDYWSRELSVNVIELKQRTLERIGYRPDAEAFLEELALKSVRRVLVTNAHPDTLHLKLQRTGLDQHLDHIVSSHNLGMPKENPQFWAALQAIEPFDPQRSLLVDDSLPVLESARDYGIAEVFGILQPDTKRPAADAALSEFILLENLGDLMRDIRASNRTGGSP